MDALKLLKSENGKTYSIAEYNLFYELNRYGSSSTKNIKAKEHIAIFPPTMKAMYATINDDTRMYILNNIFEGYVHLGIEEFLSFLRLHLLNNQSEKIALKYYFDNFAYGDLTKAIYNEKTKKFEYQFFNIDINNDDSTINVKLNDTFNYSTDHDFSSNFIIEYVNLEILNHYKTQFTTIKI